MRCAGGLPLAHARTRVGDLGVSDAPATFVFFSDAAPTEIYTLSLHDALPIYHRLLDDPGRRVLLLEPDRPPDARLDRKSTRLNSSHPSITYAVFCLKKKTSSSHGKQLLLSPVAGRYC